MLKYGLLCLVRSAVLITTSFASVTQGEPPTIVWEKIFDDAATKAKSAEKPILLDFFSPA